MTVNDPTIRSESDNKSQAKVQEDSPVVVPRSSGLGVPGIRTFQRHFVPGFVASLYYYLKYRCLVSNRASVQISDRITIGKGTVVKQFAVIQTQTGRIVIGHHCAVSSFNHISTGTADLLIGDYVRIGPNVTIMGGSRNYKRRDALIIDQGSHNPGTEIGDDVLIGANAVILPGCHIGEGAVIGAGCVVNKVVPPYSIMAGVPGKIVGTRE